MITQNLGNKILDAICGITVAASIGSGSSYLAFSSTEPDKAGANFTEPEGNGYERICLGINNQAATVLMAKAQGGSITNKTEIHSKKATGDQGILPYAGIFPTAVGGELQAWGELGKYEGDVWVPTPINPTANTVVVINAGDLKIDLI